MARTEGSERSARSRHLLQMSFAPDRQGTFPAQHVLKHAFLLRMHPVSPPPFYPPLRIKNLLEEVADLTSLLEDEAARKTDGERRSRRNLPSAFANNSGGGGGGSDGPIPSSELRRFGKKLEEAVRSREHAAEVAQRLSTGKKLPRKRVSVISSSLESTGGTTISGREGGTISKGRESPAARGGGAGAGGGGSVHRSGRNRPSQTSASESVPGRAAPELELPNHRDPIGAPAGASGGRGPAQDESDGKVAGAMDKAARQGGGRGVLTSKLRGAVRVSREEEALDDERFWTPKLVFNW